MRHSENERFNARKSPKTYDYVMKRVYKTIKCNRCGCPVIKSDVKGYSYQCMNCDEDLYKVEVHKGNKITDMELNQLLLDAEALLLLDD